MKVEVHDSPERVIMEDGLCSSSLVANKSLVISHDLEVIHKEGLHVIQCQMLEKKLGRYGSTGGPVSNMVALSSSLLSHLGPRMVGNF